MAQPGLTSIKNGSLQRLAGWLAGWLACVSVFLSQLALFFHFTSPPTTTLIHFRPPTVVSNLNQEAPPACLSVLLP
jgi:hypothetical protein